jgi:hypothetical protein
LNDLPFTLSKHLKSEIFSDELCFHDHNDILFSIDLRNGIMICEMGNIHDIYDVDELGRLMIIGVDIIE